MLVKNIDNCIASIGGSFKMETKKFRFAIPSAKDEMRQVMNDLLGKEPVWYPEYDQISDWLTDNKGQGLFLIGSVGCGKSFLTTRVIPYIVWRYYSKVFRPVKASKMNANAQEVLNAWGPIIDDVGTEGMLSEYGDKSWLFSTIVDDCMTSGRMLIANTNMTGKALVDRYSERTVDRLREICKIVVIKQQSFRGQSMDYQIINSKNDLIC